MFRSLLKYKLRANSKIILLLSVIIMSLSLLTGIVASTNLNFTYGSFLYNSFLSSVIFIVLFYYIYAIAVPLLQYYGFYKQHFENEGYFTFSLPVSTHQHVLSSVLSVLILNLFTSLVLILSMFLMVLPGLIRTGFENFHSSISIGSWSSLFLLISVLLYSCVFPLAAISLGSLVAKKHKLLAAFGISFGVSWAVTIITDSLFSSSSYRVGISDEMQIATAIIYLFLAVGGYFLTYYIFKKKVNI